MSLLADICVCRVFMCVGRITVTSSQEDGGTRLTTVVRDAALPASPVLRARVTVSLTRTVSGLAGLGVETISASTLSISLWLSIQTTRPGLASPPQAVISVASPNSLFHTPAFELEGVFLVKRTLKRTKKTFPKTSQKRISHHPTPSMD